MSISASVISLQSKYGLNYYHESRSCRFYHFDMASNVCRFLDFAYVGNSSLGGHAVEKEFWEGHMLKKNCMWFSKYIGFFHFENFEESNVKNYKIF